MGFRIVDPALRPVLGFAMLISLGLIGVVIANVTAFWREPFARGALFAW
jgi:hypothetical protein